MTTTETKALMQKIQILYWRFFKDMPEEYMAYTVKEWQRFFQGTPAADMSDALDKHIEGSTFPPGIAEIKEQLRNVYQDRHRKKLAEQSELPPPTDRLSPEEEEQKIQEMRTRLATLIGG